MPPRYQPKGIDAPRITTQGPGSYPIDPYNRPPTDDGLSRIAAALGDLAPTLAHLGEVAQVEETNTGTEKARADFLDMKKTGMAIKDGSLAPSGSQWFRRAYHETIGQLAASQYGSDLDAAMRDPNSPIGQSTEPGDFDKWSASKREEWLKTHAGKPNGDFMAGFNATAVGAELNLRNRYVAEAGKRLEENTLSVFYAQLQTMTADLRKKNSNPEQIAFWFKTLAREKYFLNPKSGTQLNETMTEALFDAARAYEDPELLKVAAFIDTAVPGAMLDKQKVWLSKVDEVDKEIRNNRQNRLASEDKDEKRAREDKVDSIYDDLGTAFEGAQDPSKVDAKPFLDRIALSAPDQSPKLQRVIEAYRKGQAVVEDQELVRSLYSRAFNGDLTNDTIVDQFADGVIGVKTAKDLRAQLRLNRSGRGSKALIQDPYYTSGVHDLTRMFVNDQGLTDPHRQTAAEQQLRREWVEWRQGAGATADTQTLVDWIQNATNRNFLRFAPGASFGSQRLLDRYKESPQPDAATRGPQPLQWEKSVVLDALDLDQLAREHARIMSGDLRAFSPRALLLIERFKLKNGATIDPSLVTKFIGAQRLARAVSPQINERSPDPIR